MSVRDPFNEGRDAAEDLRRAVESIREDVRAVVREEVADQGLPESELKRMVGRLVREELAAARSRRPRRPAAALLAAGLAAGLLAGAVGYRVLAGSPGDETGAGVTVAPPRSATSDTGGDRAAGESVAGTSAEEPPGGRTTPEERAARYDSLVRVGAPELAPLLADLEGAAAAPVLNALATWRAGDALEPGPRRRFHDALVQAALNRLSGAGLTLDGLVARNPCGGASCGALLRLWERREGEWDLPRYPQGAEAREAGLPIVERVLVLRALEASGG